MEEIRQYLSKDSDFQQELTIPPVLSGHVPTGFVREVGMGCLRGEHTC